MASVSHEPVTLGRGRPQWAEFLPIPEMWAALAIVTMWVAVLFDAVYGPLMSQIRTSVLPVLSPRMRPASASGACSRPSTIVSR
jgi:hypothetical protein